MVGFPFDDEEEEGAIERASRAAVVMRMSEAVSVLADASIVLVCPSCRKRRGTGERDKKKAVKEISSTKGVLSQDFPLTSHI